MIETPSALRSADVGHAIQRLVAADNELAGSIIGVGLDALSSALIHKPDYLASMAGWIDLIGAVRDYIERGEQSETIAALLAGTLEIRNLG